MCVVKYVAGATDPWEFGPYSEELLWEGILVIAAVEACLIGVGPAHGGNDNFEKLMSAFQGDTTAVTETVERELFVQLAFWNYLFDTNATDGGVSYLQAFEDLLDADEVWREAVAGFASRVGLRKEFVWELFTQVISRFPALIPTESATSVAEYCKRNVAPEGFDHAVEIWYRNSGIAEVVELLYCSRVDRDGRIVVMRPKSVW